MTTHSLRSKRKGRMDTENRIIHAGMTLFSKYGFDGTTTKMISQNAGVNESLIMRYFQSKEGLFLHLTRQFSQEIETKELSYPPCPTLLDEMRNYLLIQMKEIDKRSDFVRMAISRIWVDKKFMKKFKTLLSEGDPRLYHRLERLQSMGQIPKTVDLRIATYTIMFQGFATIFLGRHVLGHDEKTFSESIHLFTDNFARGLANSI